MNKIAFIIIAPVVLLLASCAQVAGTGGTSMRNGVVYFWGKSCRACQIQDGEIRKFRDKSSFPVKKINPTPQMISQLKLTHYPTILVFRDGKEVKRYTGVVYVDQLLQATGYYNNSYRGYNTNKTTETTTKTTTKPVGRRLR